MHQAIPVSGLYSLDDVRDNCGFGLIAHVRGEASHDLLKTAIHSLSCMTHRGAIAGDGKTGDGCGLMMTLPDGFFRAVVSELWVYHHPSTPLLPEHLRPLDG